MEECAVNHRPTTSDPSAPTSPGRPSWQRSWLPEALGTCFVDRLALGDGLTVAYASYTPRVDLTEIGEIERERCLTVAVALEGRSSTVRADGRRFDFVAGHSTVAAYASVRGERRFPARQSVRQLRLIVEAPLLRRYGLEDLLDGAGDDPAARRPASGRHGGAVRRLADSLIHLRDQGGSLLDMQVCALGLLAEHVGPFVRPGAATGGMRPADQDAMLRARDLLSSQFDRPLTVAALCLAVGVNEFKLKQGFRAMFGTSPHRMLTDIRMKRAWELLETGLHVSTVGYKVGYAHLSSFSAAFERYHGRAPSTVTRARRRD
jgi:AraC-like DNA-binding protein